MYRRTVSRLCLIALVGAILRPAEGQQPPTSLSSDAVRRAIDRGVDYLRGQQNRVNGTWVEMAEYKGGVTALCTLALLNAGVPAEDATIQRALSYLRSLGKLDKTYTVALQTMVFCAAQPKKHLPMIRGNAVWLEHIQRKSGPANGSWWYGETGQSGDNSNSQFALLALYEAERAGVKVNESTWRRAQDYWLREQRDDGSWGYRGSEPSSGSMTCAGIASLAITFGRLSLGDARVVDGTVECCGAQEQNDAIQRGLDWLGRNFSVTRNPDSRIAASRAWLLYYLYGVERVGRVTGHRFIGEHDWYREGADFLLSQQDTLSGSWQGFTFVETRREIATALALLFLSKGRRPVLMAKLKHDPPDDWNRHRSDVANLTRYVESKWKKDMTWQTVDLAAAAVEDLLQSPVLYITGRDGLDLTAAEKEKLRGYVSQGGFLFAENCCGGRVFDRQFRGLMKELFATDDNEDPLRLLPPEHPVWFAEEKVDPKYVRPLWGIEACCRTSVVYCPEDLSCYWELGGTQRGDAYPQAVQDEIAAVHAIGANVLAYATNRELRDKLDILEPIPESDGNRPPARGTLHVAKLRHGGGSDDAPAALTNLLRVVNQQARLPVSLERHNLSPLDESLPDYPILFMHGRTSFRWTQQEREAIADFVNTGGVLFADAICASKPFADAFRREMELIFPGVPLNRIPPTHPMFSLQYHGFDLSTVTLRDPHQRARRDDPLRARLERVPPMLEGLEIDGKYAVIFSPYDISCALEYHASLECKGYVREDAARIGVNVILYALQQ